MAKANLSAPTQSVWLVCLIVAIVALVAWLLNNFSNIDVLSVITPSISFFGMTFAYGLLMLATKLKGL